MYRYSDRTYQNSIVALRVYHAKKVFLFRGVGAMIFLLFAVVIALILWDKGAWVFLSLPLSLLVTFLYYVYTLRDVKKKGMAQNMVTHLSVQFLEESMEVTSFLRNRTTNQVTFLYTDLAGMVETKEYLFLYKDKLSALALDKRRMGTDGWLEFLKSKVKVKG